MMQVRCPGCTYSGQPHLENCPRGSYRVFSHTVSLSKVAKKAAGEIARDLQKRCDLDSAWESIDREIRIEIQERWAELIEEAFRHPEK